ncbi:hypothetical protein BKA63DRAFT_499065 [Paraphoma chrysanthemicola]|nr:hypothetical protein BKA63DRAFT_499065 [Paraphoma chrysanthemicola]
MVNAKNVAFKVNKQTPINQGPLQAYGTVINCRKPGGKRSSTAKDQKEVRSHHVPLNVEGTLKRKRGEEEDGAHALFALLGVEVVPDGAHRWQSPKLPRIRKSKLPSKGVDMDCWYIILSFSDPAQLLELRTNIPSCYYFLRDNPMLWKLSRMYHYGDLPDPPSELTEFQYADLRHDHGCMSCKAPNTRKTYWAFLRRWCKTCLQSKTLKEHDAMVMLRTPDGEDLTFLANCLPSGIFDSWGNFVGVGPATTHALKTVFLLSDVRQIVAAYAQLKAQNEDDHAEWSKNLRAWILKKTELVEERKAFAHKMEAWEETIRNERSYDYSAKKSKRKTYFQKKASELTPAISVREMECCPSYRRAIAIPKDPNNTSWLQLKPKLEKEAAELKATGGPPEDRARVSSTPGMTSGTSTPLRSMDFPHNQQPQLPYMLPMIGFNPGMAYHHGLPNSLPSNLPNGLPHSHPNSLPNSLPPSLPSLHPPHGHMPPHNHTHSHMF